MSWLRSRRIDKRREPRIEFLGEQDGPAERELKARIGRVLDLFASVDRASLARVGFKPDDEVSVALCRAAKQPNPAVLRAIQTEFRALFAKRTFLDVIVEAAPSLTAVGQSVHPT